MKHNRPIQVLCNKVCYELELAGVMCRHVAVQEERANIKESAQWSINFQLGNPVRIPAVQPNVDSRASQLPSM